MDVRVDLDLNSGFFDLEPGGFAVTLHHSPLAPNYIATMDSVVNFHQAIPISQYLFLQSSADTKEDNRPRGVALKLFPRSALERNTSVSRASSASGVTSSGGRSAMREVLPDREVETARGVS